LDIAPTGAGSLHIDFRDHIEERGVVEGPFAASDETFSEAGYLAQGGQIVDASIVPVPKQRNSREEHAAIKAGDVPAGWQDKPATLSQKDLDVRWTKKHGKSYYGYENHLSVDVDKEHKLIRAPAMFDAAVHDSRIFAAVLVRDNASAEVGADSAYWLRENRRLAIGERHFQPHSLARNEKQAVEQAQAGDQPAPFQGPRPCPARACHSTQGHGWQVRPHHRPVWATAKIGMTNLVYNLRRYVWPESRSRAPVST